MKKAGTMVIVAEAPEVQVTHHVYGMRASSARQ